MIYRNGLLPSLHERELLGYKSSYLPNQFSYAFTCEGKNAGLIRVDPNGGPCPPYCITYNKVVNGCRFLTVGDEEGSVSIVDTGAEQLPSSLYTDHATPPRAKWLAHNNTIYDIAWAKSDSVLFTASGDQHVGVWDTTTGRLLVYCAGHDGSVKAVSPHSSQPDVFASGSRDGTILLWDLRTPSSWSAAKRRMQLSPVLRVDTTTAAGRQLPQAAAGAAEGGGSRAARRSRKSRSDCVPRRSVTSLLFVRQEHTMISSSDYDGVIKLWDLRKMTVPTGDITLLSGPAARDGAASAAAARSPGPCAHAGGRRVERPAGGRSGVGGAADEGVSWLSFSGTSKNSRAAGIICMALSSAGDMLLVSSIDSCHHLYRVSGLDQQPLACLTGHRASSFCVKSCFSPSGSHVLSGSTDKRAYIWDVSRPTDPPASLPGHAGEVTAVAWCPADDNHIATAADDATLRVWTIDRANTKYQRDYEQTNVLFPAQHEQQQQGLWERSRFSARCQAAVQTQTLTAGDKGTSAVSAEAPVSASNVAVADGAAAPDVVRSTCSPVTPQLPLWSTTAAGGGGGDSTLLAAGNTTGTPAATDQVLYHTPASRKCKASCVGVSPSLPPLHPAPAAARHSATPKLKQITIAQQLSAIKAKQTLGAARQAAAAANPDAAAEYGRVHELVRISHQQRGDVEFQDQQDVQVDSKVSAADVASTAAAAALPPANMPGAPDQHTRHPLAVTRQALRATDQAAAAAVASCLVPDEQQAIADWMNTLTPSPASSPGSQQQQQQHTASRVPHRRGGAVELSTPWDLPTPLQQQRQQQRAALEAERLQRSMQLRDLSLQECDEGSPTGSNGQSSAGTGSQGMADISCCRLLQDEFEVYCDGSIEQTAAAGTLDSHNTAPTPQGGGCREKLWQQHAAETARQDATNTPAALAATGDDILEESPADIDMVPSSLPSQDVMHRYWPPQELTHHIQQQQQLHERFQQLLEPQVMQVQGTGFSQQPLHLHQVVAVAVAGSKPSTVLTAGAVRTPLGDLSPLLPAQQEHSKARQYVLHSPANNIATTLAVGSSAGPPRSGSEGHGAGLSTLLRSSPVRASPLTAARTEAVPASQRPADTAADSPVLQMLLQGKQASKKRRQQEWVHACSPGPTTGSRASHHCVLLSPPRQSTPGGRQLSRLGDRHISPLLAAKQLLTPARSPKQQQQGLGASTAAAAATAGGVLSILPGGWANKVPEREEQQQPCAVLLDNGDDVMIADAASGNPQQQQQQPPASGTGGNWGGIKRSFVFGGSNHKKQCTLADLWTAHEPEVEDGASRFSGF